MQVRDSPTHRAAAPVSRPPPESGWWRRLALGLLVFGSVGTAAELLLLEHFEDPWQWTPIALLGLGLLSGSAVLFRASPVRVRALQILMSSYLLAGGLGVYFHLKANLEFERELNPAVAGSDLILNVLGGAMPALAPGAMAQLGLLGLLLCFRHPSLARGDPDAHS